MSQKEAATVNPVQLLLLEVSYSTFFSLCRSVDISHRLSFVNSHLGVYVAIFANLHGAGVSRRVVTNEFHVDSIYDGTSNAASIASGRISYIMGLTGPCFPIDSACSSSLVAIHVAIIALSHVECNAACVIGGGILEAGTHSAFCEAGMLSNNGRCHSFDSRADGYCRGEGCVGLTCTY